MKWQSKSLVSCIAVLVGTSSAYGGDLEKLKTALNRLRVSQMSFDYTEQWTSALKPEGVTRKIEGQFWGNQTRSRLELVESFDSPSASTFRSQFLFKDSEFVVWAHRDGEPYPRLAPPILWGKANQGQRDDYSFASPFGSTPSFLLLGIFDGVELERYFPDGFKDANYLKVEHPKFGKLEASFDEKSGLPVVLESVKGQEHYRNGGKIADHEMGGGNVWPRGGITAIKTKAHEIKIAEANGVPYFSEATITQEVHTEAGITVDVRITMNVRDINFDTPAEENLLFHPTIPVNTPVHLANSQLDYIWDGDWAVPGK